MVRVLVIEDDVYMRELICHVLEDTPYRVVEAANAEQGLLFQASEPANVVITDMGLPDGDGLDVIWAIRCQYPNTEIMAISGGGLVAEEELFPKARAMGVRYTLQKPFRFEDMLEGLATLTKS